MGEEEPGLVSHADAGSSPGVATLSPRGASLYASSSAQRAMIVPPLQVAVGLTEIMSVSKSDLDFRNQI